MRVFDAISRQPWLITEEGLRTILAIAERSLADVDLAALVRAEREARPSAVAQATGRPLDGTRSVTVRDGVAILDIEGPIVRRADFFSAMSGATSIETLALDLSTALQSPGVTSILLVVDSPGGEVTGVNEFAAQIAAADKPVWAYVEGLGASAAYWIASAADHIVLDATAGVGSIGVVMAVQDPEKSTAKTIEIVSSQSPKKRPDVRTEGGRQQLQTIVDDIATVFIDSVAVHRGVDAATVASDFGQGDIFIGQRALDAGLADAIGSFESTLAELAAAGRSHAQHPGGTRAAAQEDFPMAQADKGFWTNFFGGLFGAAADAGAPLALAADTDGAPAAPVVSAPAAQPAPAAGPDPKVAQIEAQAAEDRKALAEAQATIAKMQTDARAARLTALAEGFHGETAAHVTVLTTLADAGGEDGPAFAAYVQNAKAMTEAARSGKLFAELGSDKSAAGDTATERFTGLVAAKQKADPALTYGAAVAAVAQAEPALYDAYAAENTQKIG